MTIGFINERVKYFKIVATPADNWVCDAAVERDID